MRSPDRAPSTARSTSKHILPMSSNHQINDQILPTSCCPHLSAFSANNGPKPFRFIQDCLRAKPPNASCSTPSRSSIRRELPSEIPRCGTCFSSFRLYACLACAAVSCHCPPNPSHAVAHASSSPPGHEIAVDVNRAELFCCACREQVYHRDFDAAVVLSHTSADSSASTTYTVFANLRKRRRVEYKPWTPDMRESLLVINGSSALGYEIPSDPDPGCLPCGLRGLNNLGNTCFMNSVLQALLHTPPLRNYFLSDRHNRYYCKQKNVSAGNSAMVCLACDMDAMFSAVFSGDQKPYTPAKFLYSWWQHAANLASYEQQDAHEFFMSMLDGIHENMDRNKCRIRNQGYGECCIAHKVFSGLLRSDVMCMVCGFTSTTYDPCLDISLDLEPHQIAKTTSRNDHSCNGDTDFNLTSKKCGISTLIGCLDGFTKPERLGSDQKFFCQQCQVRQESLKQMSIRKLPLVSCFHIKRFEHSSMRKMSRKIDCYLQFPFSLDLSPYLSSSILRSRFGNRIFPFDGNELDAENELVSEFELFAVITHTGKLDAGHYVTYLRLCNKWYKCDDAWITPVNETVVRAAQGYMMFYVQKILYYKANEK